jgi:hypothetical protein
MHGDFLSSELRGVELKNGDSFSGYRGAKVAKRIHVAQQFCARSLRQLRRVSRFVVRS